MYVSCIFSMQKFKRRTGVVTSVEMEQYWQHLNLYYVTEESDDAENPNGIIEHKLPWRAKRRSKEYCNSIACQYSILLRSRIE